VYKCRRCGAALVGQPVFFGMAAAALDRIAQEGAAGEAVRTSDAALPSAVSVDLGNLAAYDPRPLNAADFKTE
jgi:hypothetical protein